MFLFIWLENMMLLPKPSQYITFGAQRWAFLCSHGAPCIPPSALCRGAWGASNDAPRATWQVISTAMIPLRLKPLVKSSDFEVTLVKRFEPQPFSWLKRGRVFSHADRLVQLHEPILLTASRFWANITWGLIPQLFNFHVIASASHLVAIICRMACIAYHAHGCLYVCIHVYIYSDISRTFMYLPKIISVYLGISQYQFWRPTVCDRIAYLFSIGWVHHFIWCQARNWRNSQFRIRARKRITSSEKLQEVVRNRTSQHQFEVCIEASMTWMMYDLTKLVVQLLLWGWKWRYVG